MENLPVKECSSVQSKLESAVDRGRAPEFSTSENEHLLQCEECRTVALLLQAGIPAVTERATAAAGEAGSFRRDPAARERTAEAIMVRIRSIRAAGSAAGNAAPLPPVAVPRPETRQRRSRIPRFLKIAIPLAAAALLLLTLFPTHTNNVQNATSGLENYAWEGKEKMGGSPSSPVRKPENKYHPSEAGQASRGYSEYSDALEQKDRLADSKPKKEAPSAETKIPGTAPMTAAEMGKSFSDDSLTRDSRPAEPENERDAPRKDSKLEELREDASASRDFAVRRREMEMDETSGLKGDEDALDGAAAAAEGQEVWKGGQERRDQAEKMAPISPAGAELRAQADKAEAPAESSPAGAPSPETVAPVAVPDSSERRQRQVRQNELAEGAASPPAQEEAGTRSEAIHVANQAAAATAPTSQAMSPASGGFGGARPDAVADQEEEKAEMPLRSEKKEIPKGLSYKAEGPAPVIVQEEQNITFSEPGKKPKVFEKRKMEGARAPQVATEAKKSKAQQKEAELAKSVAGRIVIAEEEARKMEKESSLKISSSGWKKDFQLVERNLRADSEVKFRDATQEVHGYLIGAFVKDEENPKRDGSSELVIEGDDFKMPMILPEDLRAHLKVGQKYKFYGRFVGSGHKGLIPHFSVYAVQ